MVCIDFYEKVLLTSRGCPCIANGHMSLNHWMGQLWVVLRHTAIQPYEDSRKIRPNFICSITKTVFGNVPSEVCMKSMSQPDVTSGSRGTVIYRLNGEVTPDPAFHPPYLAVFEVCEKEAHWKQSDGECHREVACTSVVHIAIRIIWHSYTETLSTTKLKGAEGKPRRPAVNEEVKEKKMLNLHLQLLWKR
jgi:hypothetical protein